MEYFMIYIGIAVIPAIIAEKKGRNFFLWWAYGFVFFIVVALIHSLLLKPLENNSNTSDTENSVQSSDNKSSVVSDTSQDNNQKALEYAKKFLEERIKYCKEKGYWDEDDKEIISLYGVIDYMVPRGAFDEFFRTGILGLLPSLTNTQTVNRMVSAGYKIVPILTILTVTENKLFLFYDFKIFNYLNYRKFQDVDIDIFKDTIDLKKCSDYDINYGIGKDCLKKSDFYSIINIDDIKEFKKIIEAKTNPMQSQTSSVKNSSIPEQIKALSDLKEQGILTEKEFNEKKKKLLDQI